jgi:glutaredoxin
MRLITQFWVLLTGRPLRSPESQKLVDEQARQLSLYQLRGCPYCMKVRWVIRRLQLNVELRDAGQDITHKLALMQQGGRFQAPCLRIENKDGAVRWMYESSDIIHYLERRFATA